jgi:hypothetical protein
MRTRIVHFADGRVMEIPIERGDFIEIRRGPDPVGRIPLDEYEDKPVDIRVERYRIVEGDDGKWYAIITD